MSHARSAAPPTLARVSFVLVTALLAAFVPVSSSAAADGRRATYVVELADGVDPERSARSIAREYGGDASLVYDEALSGFAFVGTKDAARRLAADRRIRGVETDHVYRIADKTANASHQRRTDAPRALARGYDGFRQTIAILDTGVRASHEVFRAHNNIRRGVSCAGGNTADQEGHGTATASNAVGRLGVAHRAKVIPVKIFPAGSLNTTLSRVICGLNWVAREADDRKIGVANMSFAGPPARSLRRAVEKVLARNVVLVAAVGNNFGGAPGYPAAYANVIGVSALAGGNTMAGFSAAGGRMTAPGHNILSAENDSNRAYSRRSGTSRAAPQVAGAAAIILGEGAGGVFSKLRASGKCPNGTFNGSGPYCPGRWRGDDPRAEPLVNAFCAGIFANNLPLRRCRS